MIVIAAVVFGILLGLRSARAQGGSRLDLLQYATIYAIAFGVLGVFVTIIMARSLAG